MNYKLKNEVLEISIAAMGAELTSIKDSMERNISGRVMKNHGTGSHQYYFHLLEGLKIKNLFMKAKNIL